MQEPQNLSKSGELLAAKVASGSKIKDAAKDAGLTVDSAYQVSRTKAFKLRVSEIQTEALNATIGTLGEASAEAVEVLRGCLTEESPAIRVNAAKAILSTVVPLSENLQLRERLEEIEQRLAESGEANPEKPCPVDGA